MANRYLSDTKDEVLRLLRETGTTYWSTREIWQAIHQAMTDLSIFIPWQKKITTTTSYNTRPIYIDANFLSTVQSYNDALPLKLIKVEKAEFRLGYDPQEFRNVKRFGDQLLIDCSFTPLPIAISTITDDGSTCTVVTASAHGLVAGDYVTITGTTSGTYDVANAEIQSVTDTTTFVLNTISSGSDTTGYIGERITLYCRFGQICEGFSISSIDGDATDVTIVTHQPHHLIVGDNIKISGTANYNIATDTVKSITNSTTFKATTAANYAAETDGWVDVYEKNSLLDFHQELLVEGSVGYAMINYGQEARPLLYDAVVDSTSSDVYDAQQVIPTVNVGQNVPENYMALAKTRLSGANSLLQMSLLGDRRVEAFKKKCSQNRIPRVVETYPED